MRDVLVRLELLAAWLKPGGTTPDEPIPDKYSTLAEAIAEIKRLRVSSRRGSTCNYHEPIADQQIRDET